MTLEKLRALASSCLDDGGDWFPIVLPKGWRAPKGFPRGELLQEKEDGSRVVRVNAKRMLRWLNSPEVRDADAPQQEDTSGE
jgi:hypothetical protein